MNMKVLLLILFLFSLTNSYGVEIDKIPCDDFKQLIRCVEQSKDIKE